MKAKNPPKMLLYANRIPTYTYDSTDFQTITKLTITKKIDFMNIANIPPQSIGLHSCWTFLPLFDYEIIFFNFPDILDIDPEIYLEYKLKKERPILQTSGKKVFIIMDTTPRDIGLYWHKINELQEEWSNTVDEEEKDELKKRIGKLESERETIEESLKKEPLTTESFLRMLISLNTKSIYTSGDYMKFVCSDTEKNLFSKYFEETSCYHSFCNISQNSSHGYWVFDSKHPVLPIAINHITGDVLSFVVRYNECLIIILPYHNIEDDEQFFDYLYEIGNYYLQILDLPLEKFLQISSKTKTIEPESQEIISQKLQKYKLKLNEDSIIFEGKQLSYFDRRHNKKKFCDEIHAGIIAILKQREGEYVSEEEIIFKIWDIKITKKIKKSNKKYYTRLYERIKEIRQAIDKTKEASGENIIKHLAGRGYILYLDKK